MPHTTLHIKNMVCQRCIKVVRDELTKIGIDVVDVQLGAVIVNNFKSWKEVEVTLNDNGFRLLTNREEQVIERIKQVAIQLARRETSEAIHLRNSDWIARQIGMSYGNISKLFSQKEGLTLEKFLILQRLERVKELIQDNEYNLSQIAAQLGYQSVQHLSNQFKKYFNQSVSEYKMQLNAAVNRKPIDKIV